MVCSYSDEPGGCQMPRECCSEKLYVRWNSVFPLAARNSGIWQRPLILGRGSDKTIGPPVYLEITCGPMTSDIPTSSGWVLIRVHIKIRRLVSLRGDVGDVADVGILMRSGNLISQRSRCELPQVAYVYWRYIYDVIELWSGQRTLNLSRRS